MTTIPFALSVHSLVSSAGADAGFAAIVGLAILVLLYFAQARETATLRDRLNEAGQRVEYLEARLGQLHRAQAAAAQGPAGTGRPGVAPRPAVAPRPGGLAGVPPAGAAITAARGRGAPLPAAPAGMAAPALAAATRLIPPPTPAPALAAAAPPPPGLEDPDGNQTQVRSPAVVGAGMAGLPADAPPDDTILVAPATAAAANGRSKASGVAPAPVAGAPGFPNRAPAGSGARPPSPPARQFVPGRPPGSREPSPARRLVLILVGLAVVGAAVVVLILATRSGTSTTRVHRSGHVTARSKHKAAAAVDPAIVTVAVLNGTGVTNLAHDIASRLATSGYKEGAIATAADQTHNTTIVAYLPGHQLDARAVAGALNLSSSAVLPVDQQAMGVACPGSISSSTCPADVVVTVGSDLSSAAANPSG